jgi:hypothetical protein
MADPMPESRPLPDRYPDAEDVGPFRFEDVAVFGLRIRMTVTLADPTVALWELEDEHPTMWVATVYRIGAERPAIYLNYNYERRLNRSERYTLAQLAADFWKG